MTKKRRGLWQIFINSRAQSLKFDKSVPLVGLCLADLAVLWWGRRAETWEWAVWSEDVLGHTGKNSSLFWNVFGNGGWPLWGQKNWQHQCASLFTNMGIQTLAEGSKPW